MKIYEYCTWENRGTSSLILHNLKELLQNLNQQFPDCNCLTKELWNFPITMDKNKKIF
jgi:hypothetical protein